MSCHLSSSVVFFWPNADAGSEDVARGIRKFRETYPDSPIRFYKNFPFETFIRLMQHCACMIGNSSAAIREGAFLGTPAVNIGTRQTGRERGKNVSDAGYDREDIIADVQKHLQHGRYPRDPIYGDGHAGKRIADILASTPLHVQKRITW